MFRILVLMALVPVLGAASCGRSDSAGGGTATPGAAITDASDAPAGAMIADNAESGSGSGGVVESGAVSLVEADSKESDVEVIKPGDRLPMPREDFELTAEKEVREAVIAGGCFWCTEAVYEMIEGVEDVVSGYCGGKESTADYRTVSAGITDHAEAIRISYDAGKITYGGLLRVFFAAHDPTQLNRQGPDRGRHYRSAVFYANDEEKRIIESYIEQLTAAEAFSRPIVTTVEANTGFYEAEDYHQDYARLNPDAMYIRSVSDPKVEKVRSKYQDLIKFDLMGDR